MAALLLHVLLDGERDDPLAARPVVDVLPLGPDALLEEHVVGVGHDLLDGVNVVVHAPEVLERGERVDLVQDVLVVPALLALLLLLVVGQRVNVPEGPSASVSKLNTYSKQISCFTAKGSVSAFDSGWGLKAKLLLLLC